MVHTSSKVKASATRLLRSLCSLAPISIAFVSTSGFAVPTTLATSSAGPTRRNTQVSPQRKTSAVDSDSLSIMEGACSTSTSNKHSYRSIGHPSAPEHLKLKQVIVICRHGDRAPVASNLGTLLNDGPKSVSLWSSKLPATEEVERWSEAFPSRVLGDDGGQTVEEILASEGPWGQLTTRGAEELRLVGEGLRDVIDGSVMGGGGGGRLFPAGLDAEKSSIFVRGTRIKRTHHSAQNLLFGLGLTGGVNLYVRPNERETLWPSQNNRGRQNDLIAEANAANEWPGQAELKRDTAKMIGLEEDELKWTTVREVVSCFEAHGVPLPDNAIESGLVRSVVEYTGWMWGRWFGNREMVRLSLGPFLSEVLTIMGARGDEEGVPEAGMPSRPKLAIFSGHDSTLVPILAALNIYSDDWPPYASYISLDVAEDEEGATLVRLVYNGQEALLHMAAGPWIPLADLAHRLEDVMPREEDSAVNGSPQQEGSSEISAAVDNGKGKNNKAV